MDINAAQSVNKANSDLEALKKNPAGVLKAMFNTPGRPLPITVIAWLGVIGVVLGVLAVVAMLAVHPIAAILSIVFLLVTAACCLGFFGMRKWAVLLYGAVTALSILNMLIAGSFSIVVLIIPAIILAICFKYYPKMT